MEEKRRKVGVREHAARVLALPGESAGLPRLELTGDREVFLENYRDILSYSREELTVDGGKWMVRITGRDLEIKAMSLGQLRIVGWVTGLEII